jgi:hypothetical protein
MTYGLQKGREVSWLNEWLSASPLCLFSVESISRHADDVALQSAVGSWPVIHLQLMLIPVGWGQLTGRTAGVGPLIAQYLLPVSRQKPFRTGALCDVYYLCIKTIYFRSRDRLISIVSRLRAGWPSIRSSIPGLDTDVSLLHSVQTGSDVHSASSVPGVPGVLSPCIKHKGRIW